MNCARIVSVPAWNLGKLSAFCSTVVIPLVKDTKNAGKRGIFSGKKQKPVAALPNAFKQGRNFRRIFWKMRIVASKRRKNNGKKKQKKNNFLHRKIINKKKEFFYKKLMPEDFCQKGLGKFCMIFCVKDRSTCEAVHRKQARRMSVSEVRIAWPLQNFSFERETPWVKNCFAYFFSENSFLISFL